MNRRTTVVFPVFNGYSVRVILARNIQATGRVLRVDLSDAQAAHISDPAKPKRGWIVLGPKASEADMAHEASHAVRAMFKVMGIRSGDEIFAYHLDYLVGRIHGFIKKRT
jgi:hypothetical protein